MDFNIADYDQRSPIHLAASNGHLAIVKYLFAHGVKNVNPLDRFNNTPLDDSIREGHEEISNYLK